MIEWCHSVLRYNPVDETERKRVLSEISTHRAPRRQPLFTLPISLRRDDNDKHDGCVSSAPPHIPHRLSPDVSLFLPPLSLIKHYGVGGARVSLVRQIRQTGRRSVVSLLYSSTPHPPYIGQRNETLLFATSKASTRRAPCPPQTTKMSAIDRVFTVFSLFAFASTSVPPTWHPLSWNAGM